MSYLSTALNRLSELQGLSQSDLVRASRLSRSHISRLFAGEPNHLADHHFVALLRCFGRDPQHQSELVAARCLDVRVGPGADRVRVTVDTDPAPPTSAEGTPHSAHHDPRSNAFPAVTLASETERAITWLRGQCPVNPDLEQHLVSYAPTHRHALTTCCRAASRQCLDRNSFFSFALARWAVLPVWKHLRGRLREVEPRLCVHLCSSAVSYFFKR